MYNTNENATNNINGEIKRLVDTLRSTPPANEKYFIISRSVNELAQAVAALTRNNKKD